MRIEELPGNRRRRLCVGRNYAIGRETGSWMDDRLSSAAHAVSYRFDFNVLIENFVRSPVNLYTIYTLAGVLIHARNLELHSANLPGLSV